MRLRPLPMTLVCLALLPCLPRSARIGAAQTKTPDVVKLLGQTSVHALAGAMRGFMVELMPPVLLDKKYDWGKQKLVARGLKWKGIKPEVQRSHKNHGKWKKIRVEAPNLRDTLIFDIRDAKSPSPGRVTFTTFTSFDTRIYYDQQNWRSGVRTWAGSIRARARIKLTMACEVITRTEKKPGQLFSDVVFQIRVVWASFRYDNFVVEHVPGFGGEMAQLLGDAAKRVLGQWKPSIERELIIKSNAAIVKAGQTKEVRINLNKLFAGFAN